MTDWTFAVDEVLEDRDGKWWHVLTQWEEVNGDGRKYELADATHTEYKTLHAGDVEGLPSEEPLFTSAGWSSYTKPASVEGYRVNGVLCGPSNIDHWRSVECAHDYECPECGREGAAEIDIIHSHENGEVVETRCECRICNHTWVDN